MCLIVAIGHGQITNRKSLAFTSKTPGKTQQFNYFAVNDKPGREKEIRYGDDIEGEPDTDSFYIVDSDINIKE